jgi:hypothetical protein
MRFIAKKPDEDLAIGSRKIEKKPRRIAGAKSGEVSSNQ